MSNSSDTLTQLRSAATLDTGKFASNAEDSMTLPSSWYYDADIHRREHDAIFFRNWWYQCHVTDVANQGDYFVGSVIDQEVLITRDDHDELHAFYNVCSHRAHPLLQGQGNTALIVCPYHQWCYTTNGCFNGAKGRQTLQGWIPENADLKPVRLENYGGFLFVNLDPDATPLREQAPQFLQDMRECCPSLDDLLRVKRVERKVAANWKTLVDNNHECYHCAVNHPSLMELIDYEHKAKWSDDGITFSHGVDHKERNNSAYQLNDDTTQQTSLFGYIWPNQIPLFFPGSPSMVMFQILPTGPETSTVRHDFYFISRDLSPQENEFVNWVTDVLVPEDVGLCENVQRGLRSRGYHQGRFVVDRERVEFSEHHVHFFQNMVRKALEKN
ncbi:MAG: aromatic ring-hydroxylating dioxygenase subunit alpha [Pseudomonadota bacterium]